MTQREFSKRTGIATTTISNWRKKNTNPGSEKIMAICAALDVTPEYLLSGTCEDSARGHAAEFMILPHGTEEHLLLELFGELDWTHRAHLLEYAKLLKRKESGTLHSGSQGRPDLRKIADFNDIEVYMDSACSGNPSVDLYYLDDDISGKADIQSGTIYGDFSKYVLPVIKAWLEDHRAELLAMWDAKTPKMLPEWV